MDKKSSIFFLKILPAVYIALSLLYIIFIIQPTLYFHHIQPPFLFSLDFYNSYFVTPGGLSELFANFLLQSFYNKFLGPIVLLGFGLIILNTSMALANSIYKSRFNTIWALAIMSLSFVLVNNYKLPFSIIISFEAVLLMMLLLARFGSKTKSYLLIYSGSALFLYYFSGSGYMILFSISALLLAIKFTLRSSLIIIGFILGFSYLFPQLAYHYIFPIPLESKFFYLFPPKLDFMAYEESIVLYIYLFSISILVTLLIIASKFQNILKLDNVYFSKLLLALSYVLILSSVFYYHYLTYQSDAKKIVASDYYSYVNNTEKTATASRSLKDYNFIANINYNMAINRAGRLTEDFFKFFQISGTDAVHPDNQFYSEISFISADFYYDLGYISEARHWAYESLVFYPYSPRALQILVKIHLVTGEYKVAEKYLKILNKGIISRDFVSKYTPYVNDTSLIISNKEILKKRSFIPDEQELNPFIEARFKELLSANDKNKTAYEYLMLFYLLDGNLESFLELYKNVGDYFSKPVTVYEEAILMYGAVSNTDVESEYSISTGTIIRFKDFTKKIARFKGDERSARNFLYRDFGQSYMYYLQFVYPRIIKPEIIKDNEY